MGCLGDCQPKLLRTRGDCGFGRTNVQADATTKEVIWVEPAKHEIGVSDGRLESTSPITGWSGISARALWADSKYSADIDPSDRAATCADLYEVDNRRSNRVARTPAAACAGRRFCPYL